MLVADRELWESPPALEIERVEVGETMTLRRWLALSGVGAAVLFAVSFFSGGGTPNDDARAATVVKYFQDHRVGTQVFNLLGVIAAVLLILFAVRLREFLRDDGSDGGLLSTAAFGGALILAAGVMLDSAITFGLVRAARLNFAGPAQTLNVLSNNDFYIIFGGIAILLLGAGIATVRRPALPRWLGWAAIAVAILSLAGPIGFFGAILAMLWLLVVSIIIFRRDRVAAPSAT